MEYLIGLLLSLAVAGLVVVIGLDRGVGPGDGRLHRRRQVLVVERGLELGLDVVLAALNDSVEDVRTIGLANGKNPVGIIVPCHRVVGSTGNLTGYGGGLDRKRHLLDFERAH